MVCIKGGIVGKDQITLQHILLPFEDCYHACYGLFFRYGELSIPTPSATNYCTFEISALDSTYFQGWGAQIDNKAGALVIDSGTTISFCTYFNMLSAAKWRKYTGIRDISLQLDIEGDFEITLKAIDGNDIPEWNTNRNSAHQYVLTTAVDSMKSRGVAEFAVPDTDATCIGFEITASTDVVVYGGNWTAVCNAPLNRVDICLITTTFKKEDYILNNLHMLNRQVFAADSDLAEHLQVYAIDNGQTLDASDVENEHTRLFSNKNVGGAGGFARGMIEALRSGDDFTHVLIMDDDVHIMPESLHRTYTLLRLLRSEFQGHYISGAMLRDEEMNIQHEDIGIVNHEGYFASKKGHRDLYDIRSCVANEAEWTNFTDEYAAWWYCVVPMQYVGFDKLPLPLFVRGDDVEFSLRNDPGFITLNGICVWHVGFSKKYTASMECYQVMRNSLILQAAANVASDADIYNRMCEQVIYMLYQYAYDYADLILDAIEDYLKGPSFLKQADGAAIIKEKSTRNEKLLPLERYAELLPELGLDKDDCLNQVYFDDDTSLFWSFLRWRTMNGHRHAPKFFFRRKVGTTPYDWAWTLNKQTGCEAILAVDPQNREALLRKRDVGRFEQVMERRKALMDEYDVRGREVRKQWQECYPYLTSIGFWEKYLGI